VRHDEKSCSALETLPGLVVTAHSGEGKANQYLMRGYNLDHGTDLATFIGGIPVNEPSHAHGQGYTDLNFLIPELAGGLEYTKGTYYAAQGDFAGVGSVHIAYLNTIPDEVSVSGGTWGFGRLFGALSRLPSKDAEPLPVADNPLSYSESDQIHLGSNAVYTQA
jgi:TonB-dependent Receptor Plug Domain